MLNVLLADDHDVVRLGIRSIVEQIPGATIVSEHSDGASAASALRHQRPDVAILDIEMPGRTGIEIARLLHEQHLPTKVLLLSMHTEGSFVRAAVEAGVAGYLVKQDAGEELRPAIEAINRGDTFISPRVASALIESLRRGPADRVLLSPRERDVVRLLCRGMTSKEIAAELHLTPKTVDCYRATIMEKLGVRGVAGIVKYALREQLTTLDD